MPDVGATHTPGARWLADNGGEAIGKIRGSNTRALNEELAVAPTGRPAISAGCSDLHAALAQPMHSGA